MIKKTKNIRGETLAETIVALSVLAIGITIASIVITNSLRNMTNAKSRVIAVNIAREGIESMRNIRDTNWLLYSDRRRDCWNHNTSLGLCDPNSPTPITPGTYVVYRRDNDTWQLALADRNITIDSDGDSIPDNDLDLTPLSLVDIDASIDSDGDGDLTNDRDIYNHVDTDLTDPLGTEVQGTNFQRHITIEYLEHLPNEFTAPSDISEPNDSINTLSEWNDGAIDNVQLNRMRITSTVTWERSGVQHRSELKTIITDHLGRDDFID